MNSGLFFTEYFRYDGKMSIDTLPVYRLTKAVIVVAMATNWKLLSSGYHQMLSVICNLLRQYFFANATKRMSIIPYFSVVPSPSSGRFKWYLIAEKFHASKLKGHKFKDSAMLDLWISSKQHTFNTFAIFWQKMAVYNGEIWTWRLS